MATFVIIEGNFGGRVTRAVSGGKTGMVYDPRQRQSFEVEHPSSLKIKVLHVEPRHIRHP